MHRLAGKQTENTRVNSSLLLSKFVSDFYFFFSKLCQMSKTAQIGTHVFLLKFRYLRFLKIVPAQPYLLRFRWNSQVSNSADIASTFSLFKDYFDKKLSALKRDIQEDSLTNADSIAKKLKEESNISFKFEGNKKQFFFNTGLAEKVNLASKALGKRKFDVVKSCLEELDSELRNATNLSDWQINLLLAGI